MLAAHPKPSAEERPVAPQHPSPVGGTTRAARPTFDRRGTWPVTGGVALPRSSAHASAAARKPHGDPRSGTDRPLTDQEHRGGRVPLPGGTYPAGSAACEGVRPAPM